MNKPDACPVCGAKKASAYDKDDVYEYYECEVYFSCSSKYVLDENMDGWVTDIDSLCPHFPEKLDQAKEDIAYIFGAMEVWGENTSGKLAEIAKRWGLEW